MKYIILFSFAFLINIPAGYYRENFKRMSWQWLLILHSTIPFIILLRLGLGFEFFDITLILMLITTAILGQVIGSRPVRKYILNNYKKQDSTNNA